MKGSAIRSRYNSNNIVVGLCHYAVIGIPPLEQFTQKCPAEFLPYF